MTTPSKRSFALPAIGLELQVRLSGRPRAGGGVTLIETRCAPGFGPPLHRRSERQVCYVLSGRYRYEIDGKRFVAQAGDAFEVPAKARHAFVNLADKPASQLTLMLPGFDAPRCLAELQALFAPVAADPEALSQFERRWGVEFLGPPLAASPSARTPYRRHTAEFKLEVCGAIRRGAIGRREAQKKYSLSDNLIHGWLAQYDRDEPGAATTLR